MSSPDVRFKAEYVSGKSVVSAILSFYASLQVGEGYGEDPYTQWVKNFIKKRFGFESELVGSGTAANLITIAACQKPERPGIVTTDLAHVKKLERRGATRFFGANLITPGNSSLALDLDETEKTIKRYKEYISAITITIADERGTVPTLEYISSLRKICDASGLMLHGDLARGWVGANAMNQKMANILPLFNAVSLGFMKNGGPCEIICWNGLELGQRIKDYRMTLGHDRNNSVSDAILLRNSLILEAEKNAIHSVGLARILAQGLLGMNIELAYSQVTNQVFPRLSSGLSDLLKSYYAYYDDYGPDKDSENRVARFITSPSMSKYDVHKLLQVISDCQKKI